MENKFLIPASIVAAAVIIAGALIYATGGSRPVKPITTETGKPVATVTAPVSGADVLLGEASAPVTFIEYGDYQCPFCGMFFKQTEPLIREEYIKSGKVKMVFRNFQFLGPESVAAAEAAECAKDQKTFWAYHDALYNAEGIDGHENNGNLNKELFLKLAQGLNLDLSAFTACIDSKKYETKVNKDTADGQTLGVQATPTAFVNGKLIAGAEPYSVFKQAIDAALSNR